VPAEEMDFLKEAIEGHNLFTELARRYADEVIRQTRKQRKKLSPKPQRKTNRANKKGRSGKIRPQGPI
jgi:polyhydroxyalkanoate synthesis regulator phasin